MLPDCAIDHAIHYQVPVELVAAVQRAESGAIGQRVGRVGPNSNGTYDLGAMQINTWWIQDAGEKSLINWGITEQELLQNPCTNFAVGTWLLDKNLRRYQGDVVAALSAYNTGRPDSPVGVEYAWRVIENLSIKEY